jgi:cytochrome b561
MHTNPLTMPAITVLFIIVFLLGFLLRRSGKPYNGLMLTVHKLISLAVLILVILVVYRFNQATPLDSTALLTAVLTVVFFVAAIISGGLVSLDRPTSPIARALHWMTPFLTIGGVAATYLALA